MVIISLALELNYSNTLLDVFITKSAVFLSLLSHVINKISLCLYQREVGGRDGERETEGEMGEA